MRRWIGLVAGCATLAVLWWWFGLDELLAAFRGVAPLGLLLYFSCALLVLLGYSLRWGLILRSLGAAPPLGRLVAARLAGSAVGSLVPSANLAGEPVRVALARAWGQRGTEASAGVATDRVAELIGNMVCSVAYVSVFLLTRAGNGSTRAPVILLVAMLLGLVAVTIPLVMLRRGRRPFAPLVAVLARRRPAAFAAVNGALRRFEDRLGEFFRQSFATFVAALLASLAIEGLLICEFHFLLSAFGIELELPTLLLVLLGTGIAHTIPAPAALGALEAGQVAALALAGGSSDTGFVVGVIVRLHETLWLGVGLIALSVQGVSLSRAVSHPAPDEAAV